VSLLLRIAELVLIIIVVRTFLRMMFPALRKPRAPKNAPSRETPQRFQTDKHDISDADYEEVR
jgi:hypothetical protein